jgi:hypothetical protein
MNHLRNRKHARIVEQLNRVYRRKPDAAEKRIRAELKTKFGQTVKDRW